MLLVFFYFATIFYDFCFCGCAYTTLKMKIDLKPNYKQKRYTTDHFLT